MNTPRPSVRAAEVVLSCADLDATLAFFTGRLGFRVEGISPAEDPAVAVISGHGLRLRLVRGAAGSAGVLRLACDDPAAVAGGVLELVAPNGTRVELARAEEPLVLPPLVPAFELGRARDARWVTGRAGMLYRDLVPGRQGGRFVVSHIRIPDGGPVPDYVHYHRVRFQMIYCHRGWVRVVYEDQGPPFVLREGDCVLQPPEIRHRVLESSPGLEVIEITSPAAHDTRADHELALPCAHARPERTFDDQRFVRHEAARASWVPASDLAGFEACDLGLGSATGGLAAARVIRSRGAADSGERSHDGEFLFLFVLQGTLALDHAGRAREPLAAGDALAIPARHPFAFARCSRDLQLLEVELPGEGTRSEIRRRSE